MELWSTLRPRYGSASVSSPSESMPSSDRLLPSWPVKTTRPAPWRSSKRPSMGSVASRIRSPCAALAARKSPIKSVPSANRCSTAIVSASDCTGSCTKKSALDRRPPRVRLARPRMPRRKSIRRKSTSNCRNWWPAKLSQTKRSRFIYDLVSQCVSTRVEPILKSTLRWGSWKVFFL